jgi:hypothetical protein
VGCCCCFFFFGFGCYHAARSIWRIIHIRVSRKFPCTDHAVQGTFGCSGLKEALVSEKVGRVFEMPGMQLGFGGVQRSVGMQRAGGNCYLNFV